MNLQVMINLLFKILIYPGLLFGIVLGLFFRGIDRKLSARCQNRVGPPILQPFYDAIKLFYKETIKPSEASIFFYLAPLLSFASIFVALLCIPIVNNYFKSLDNLIILLYFLVLSSIFVAIGGYASGNPFAAHGSTRKIIQVFAVEFPLIISLFTVATYTKTLSLVEISTKGFIATTLPLATIAFIFSVVGELNRLPFDIPEAKTEIISGPYTEYSGVLYMFLELVHAIKHVVLFSLAVSIFFGGASTIIAYLIKFFVFGVFIVVLTLLFARVRIDKALKFYWIFVGLISVLSLVRVLYGVII